MEPSLNFFENLIGTPPICTSTRNGRYSKGTQSTGLRRIFLKYNEKFALPAAPLADPADARKEQGMVFPANTANCTKQDLPSRRINQEIQYVIIPAAAWTGRFELRAFDPGISNAEMHLPALRVWTSKHIHLFRRMISLLFRRFRF